MRQTIIAALKAAGGWTINLSSDQQTGTMQLTILKNIDVELENGNERPEPIPLPPPYQGVP